jgi:hypothetical protein
MLLRAVGPVHHTDAAPKPAEAIADEILLAYYDSLAGTSDFSLPAAIAAALDAARREADQAGRRRGRRELREEAEAAIWEVARALEVPPLVDSEHPAPDHAEALRVLEAAAMAVHELPEESLRKR